MRADQTRPDLSGRQVSAYCSQRYVTGPALANHAGMETTVGGVNAVIFSTTDDCHWLVVKIGTDYRHYASHHGLQGPGGRSRSGAGVHIQRALLFVVQSATTHAQPGYPPCSVGAVAGGVLKSNTVILGASANFHLQFGASFAPDFKRGLLTRSEPGHACGKFQDHMISSVERSHDPPHLQATFIAGRPLRLGHQCASGLGSPNESADPCDLLITNTQTAQHAKHLPFSLDLFRPYASRHFLTSGIGKTTGHETTGT